MVSYFREARLMRGVDYGTFFPVPMATNIFGAAASIFANCLVDCFCGYSRPVIFLGAIGGATSVYYCSMIKQSPHTFVIAYSAGLGILKGFFKQSAIRAALSHLSERKGLVTGLILSGHAFGGVMYTLFFSRL